MSKLKDELQKTVREMTTFDKLKDQIGMTVTSEGLRPQLRQLGAFVGPRPRRQAIDAGRRTGPKQMTQVRGFGDQRLRKPAEPEDPSNRRISVIVEYRTKGAQAAEGPAKGTPAATPATAQPPAPEPGKARKP